MSELMKRLKKIEDKHSKLNNEANFIIQKKVKEVNANLDETLTVKDLITLLMQFDDDEKIYAYWDERTWPVNGLHISTIIRDYKNHKKGDLLVSIDCP